MPKQQKARRGLRDFYPYELAAISQVNAGAEQFAFHNVWGLPQVVFIGAARLCGEVSPLPGSQALVSLAPTGNPLGMPILTNTPDVAETPLTDASYESAIDNEAG